MQHLDRVSLESDTVFISLFGYDSDHQIGLCCRSMEVRLQICMAVASEELEFRDRTVGEVDKWSESFCLLRHIRIRCRICNTILYPVELGRTHCPLKAGPDIHHRDRRIIHESFDIM